MPGGGKCRNACRCILMDGPKLMRRTAVMLYSRVPIRRHGTVIRHTYSHLALYIFQNVSHAFYFNIFNCINMSFQSTFGTYQLDQQIEKVMNCALHLEQVQLLELESMQQINILSFVVAMKKLKTTQNLTHLVVDSVLWTRA